MLTSTLLIKQGNSCFLRAITARQTDSVTDIFLEYSQLKVTSRLKAEAEINLKLEIRRENIINIKVFVGIKGKTMV